MSKMQSIRTKKKEYILKRKQSEELHSGFFVCVAWGEKTEFKVYMWLKLWLPMAKESVNGSQLEGK